LPGTLPVRNAGSSVRYGLRRPGVCQECAALVPLPVRVLRWFRGRGGGIIPPGVIAMSKELLFACSLILVVSLGVSAAQPADGRMKAYQMREDYGTEALYGCRLQYYYYVPCPTYSWFWAFTGPTTGETMGAFFDLSDPSTGVGTGCDPDICHTLDTIRILDFAGYGTVYPGLFTIEMDVYCSTDHGCPVGPRLWTSGPLETHFGWNYVDLEPPVCLTGCSADPGPPPSAPRVLVTATHTGTSGFYPAWGLDNISINVQQGCVMHDIGCLPALYPRPAASHYGTIHSGYYGTDFAYCPPIWLTDGWDTTLDGSQFGYIELLWTIYIDCNGPTDVEPSSWGNIKSIFR
jgi:hypothetical protein